MILQELVLPIGKADAIQNIAVKIWNKLPESESTMPSSKPPIIALHGWLDNAASFDLLAPLLDGFQVIAVDLPGHGRSSHRNPGAEYYIWSYVEEVLAIAENLSLDKFSMIGHSMGGAVATLVSSLYPEKVHKLALLDALGPLPTSCQESPAQMKKALDQKMSSWGRHMRYYKTRLEAIQARANKGLSIEAATLLGNRGVVHAEKGYYWASDRRLTQANLFSMSEAHVECFLKQIACPSLLISAAELLDKQHPFYSKRLKYIKTLEIVNLLGSHHQHMESEVEMIASLLEGFLN